MRRMEQLPLGPVFFCRRVIPAALVIIFGLVISGVYARAVNNCAAMVGGGWLDGLQFDDNATGDERLQEGRGLLRRARTLWEREQQQWGSTTSIDANNAHRATPIEPDDAESDNVSLLAASRGVSD